MKPLCILAFLLLCLGMTPRMAGAQGGQDVLTAAQESKIAEAGIDADARIGLYTKYAGEHADRIRRLSQRSEAGMGRAMDRELGSFASLVDELASNLDEYGGRMADMRKSLEKLDKEIPHWQELMKSLPNNSAYQISRDDASGSLSDLADQTKQLTQKEDAYFRQHKDAKGQQYEEPQQ